MNFELTPDQLYILLDSLTIAEMHYMEAGNEAMSEHLTGIQNLKQLVKHKIKINPTTGIS